MRFSNSRGDVEVTYVGDLLSITFTWRDGDATQTIRLRGQESNEVIARIKRTEEKT